MKTKNCLAILTFAALLISKVSASDKPIPDVIGLNVEDPKPESCASCHKIKSPEVDHRLITKKSMQEVEKHQVSKHFIDMQTMPGDNTQGCISCHEDFGTLMHDLHFADPEHNHFVGKYYGKVGCLACHAFAKDEDNLLQVTTKQGDINWKHEEFEDILFELEWQKEHPEAESKK